MLLRAIILGCGSSAGVPRIGGPDGAGDWGACDPNEPKNRRLRCGIAIQRAHDTLGWDADALTTVLVDTSPDLKAQLISAKIARADAVMITHDHADQTHGIDDLRVLALLDRRRVPVYVDQVRTSPALMRRFAYCFESNPETGYPAILDAREMPEAGTFIEIDGPTGSIPVAPFLQRHGPVDSLGFRFGREGGIAYSSDLNDLFDESIDLLTDVDTYIVDALRYRPHPSHAHMDLALEWIERVRATKGVLTNLHIDMDYATVLNETPENVMPAHDGMIIEAEAR